jgi:hypothetical protein
MKLSEDFVRSPRQKESGESLLSHYRRTYQHLIPEGVELLEFNVSTGDIMSK